MAKKPPPKPLKILVLRFSSIGDIVLTTPVLRGLKKQLGAEVHVLTKEAFAGMLDANPYVDEVHAFKKHLLTSLPFLRKQQYDWVIDLHNNVRSSIVKSALKCPSRSFDKLNWQKWVLTRFKKDFLPNVHIVDRYLQTVAHLGVKYDGRGLDFFIPPADEVKLARLAPNLFPGTYVSFVLGATHATKRLPVEKMIDIVRQIALPVVLLGGPAEHETGAAVAAAAGEHVIDLCGKLNLNQSASVVRQSRTVLTHDTGLMHIAAAFNKDIVSVWGNTVPKFGMYPFYAGGENRNVSVEVNGLSCRPCSKIGHDRCPKGHFRCMNDIPADAVARLCSGIFDGTR